MRIGYDFQDRIMIELKTIRPNIHQGFLRGNSQLLDSLANFFLRDTLILEG